MGVFPQRYCGMTSRIIPAPPPSLRAKAEARSHKIYCASVPAWCGLTSQLIDFAANTFFSSARFVAELRWGIQQHLLHQGDFIV